VQEWRELVKEGAAQKASDVFWKVGNIPHIRLRGVIERVEDWPVITPEFTQQLARELMTDRQWERFEDYPERDIGLTIPDVCRLRINVYRERDNVGLVMRIIPLEIATIEELELPPVLNGISMTPQGLVLVTGPTGCGKSTSLAAMIDVVNNKRKTNIVTIEDPIEYVHQDKKSIVIQRAVGIDTESFTDALKYVVRQSPDVILIGEMRDVERKPGDVYEFIQQGGYWGMQTMNQALMKLFQAGKISPGHALFYAGNYTEMRQMLRRADPAAAQEAIESQPGLIRVRGDISEAEAEPAAGGPVPAASRAAGGEGGGGGEQPPPQSSRAQRPRRTVRRRT